MTNPDWDTGSADTEALAAVAASNFARAEEIVKGMSVADINLLRVNLIIFDDIMRAVHKDSREHMEAIEAADALTHFLPNRKIM